jgi:hypothetical protein
MTLLLVKARSTGRPTRGYFAVTVTSIDLS